MLKAEDGFFVPYDDVRGLEKVACQLASYLVNMVNEKQGMWQINTP